MSLQVKTDVVNKLHSDMSLVLSVVRAMLVNQQYSTSREEEGIHHTVQKAPWRVVKVCV
jgi:hypothetical protein